MLYGHETNLPPLDPSDKGHFHAESAEFWLVFAGKIRYAFEGQEPFIASEGDVVYVPAGTWHATRYTRAGLRVPPVDHGVCREHPRAPASHTLTCVCARSVSNRTAISFEASLRHPRAHRPDSQVIGSRRGHRGVGGLTPTPEHRQIRQSWLTASFNHVAGWLGP